MTNNPLITIIVPFYNSERFLKECVDSILAQDYPNLEFYFIDDGSTDHTFQLLETYAKQDDRIVLVHQANSGVSATRNKAIRRAKGEYLCFVDADDIIDSDYVSYLYHLIEEYHADVALTPQPFKFNAQNWHQKPTNETSQSYVISGHTAAAKMMYYQSVIAPWNKMISRKLITDNHIKFREGIYGGEGFLFSEECYKYAQKVAVGSRKVYNYRLDNPASGMTKFSLKVVNDSIYSQQCIHQLYAGISPNLDRALKYANWHTHCDLLNTFIGCKVRKKYPAEYKKIQKVCKHDATCVFHADITPKEKLKGIMYLISPYLTAKLINKFRLRKFTIEE